MWKKILFTALSLIFFIAAPCFAQVKNTTPSKTVEASNADSAAMKLERLKNELKSVVKVDSARYTDSMMEKKRELGELKKKIGNLESTNEKLKKSIVPLKTLIEQNNKLQAGFDTVSKRYARLQKDSAAYRLLLSVHKQQQLQDVLLKQNLIKAYNNQFEQLIGSLAFSETEINDVNSFSNQYSAAITGLPANDTLRRLTFRVSIYSGFISSIREAKELLTKPYQQAGVNAGVQKLAKIDSTGLSAVHRDTLVKYIHLLNGYCAKTHIAFDKALRTQHQADSGFFANAEAILTAICAELTEYRYLYNRELELLQIVKAGKKISKNPIGDTICN